jgi:hypothetical protein
MTTPMHITAQKVLFPLSCCVAIRHPGQVRLRRIRALLNFPEGTLFYRASRDPDNVPAKAGNQAPNEVIVGFLDSGHPPAANSGMTGSANFNLVCKDRGNSCEANLRDIFLNFGHCDLFGICDLLFGIFGCSDISKVLAIFTDNPARAELTWLMRP